ncbi:rhamnulokinase [Pleomorphomonas koreensis]|uniref:rhamnulokinase n=1 Tax=Pleomorphomonas koreensis TaxID=257440 RepID=UPI000427A943|nr:FGGY-family carbohydrate kinase [Pleomorphomonas koreensis]
MARCLAVDYGASSVRVIDVALDDGGLTARELSRRPNASVDDGGRFWDHDGLFAAVDEGMAAAAASGPAPLGIGADSWGVDVVLVGADGRPAMRPRAYRDPYFNGWMERWLAGHADEAAVFAATGIPLMAINTLYQLYAAARLEPEAMKATRHVLLTADYVHYLLSGEAANERTLASTSQMLTLDGAWWQTALDSLGLPAGALGPVVRPGTLLGGLRPDIARRHGFGATRVVAPAAHDTQSAIVAVPAVEAGDWAYISCGTWSIIGAVSPRPFVGPDAFAAGLGNETGYGDTYCVQSTVTGLWLIQEILRGLADGSTAASLAAEAAAEPPFRSIVDPAHPRFMAPADMAAEIRAACREASEPVPDSRAAVARCAYDSLALNYRFTLADLQRVTGRRFDRVHMVGGGVRAGLLNGLTAAATGLPAVAGPIEATAIGNAITQFIALGVLPSWEEGRRLVARSFPPVVSEPHPLPGLDEAVRRFDRLRQRRRNTA